MVKHEEKEAGEKREKKAEGRWARWEEKRERRTEERWTNWWDRQRWEEKREKKAEERWTEWEDRQRLERQGDEVVDMIKRHEEEEEEEKKRQAEGMSAGDEYRMMLMMAEKHVREASDHREMVEEEAQKGIKETREKVAMEMEEMIEKGYGIVTFGCKKSGREKTLNVRRVRLKRDRRRRIECCRGIWRRQIGMKKREEFRERVRAETWRKKGRVAKLLEV